MKIGIDIDEIITKYIDSFIEFLRIKKQKVLDYNTILDCNDFGHLINLDKNQVQEYIQEHTNQRLTLLELDLIEGSLEAINLLHNSHEIIFITSRHPSNKGNTLKFFEKHFPRKKFKIIFSGDAHKGNKLKSEICKEEGCEIMIEDNPNYALDCANKGIKVFLMNKPWNQKIGFNPNIIKVNNWNEIIDNLK